MSDWIRGELRADYDAAGFGGPAPIVLTGGEVRGAAQVEGPPSDPDANELRQDDLPAHLSVDEALHPTVLRDVRIRGWARVPGAGPPAIAGTVWARLDDPPPPPEAGAVGCVRVLVEVLLVTVGLGATWLAGGPGGAGFWAAVGVAALLLRSAGGPTLPRWVGAPLLLAQLGLTVAVLHAAGADPCGPRPWWVAAALALPALAAGRFAVEPPGVSLLWTLGLIVWWAAPGDDCLAGRDTATAAIPLARAGERAATELRARAMEAMAADDGAALIAEATHRWTLDEAMHDPAAFFTCEPRVVISGEVLFLDENSTLRWSATAHLRTLRRLLAQGDGTPQVVVEVHVPPGEAAVERSRARARALVDWLAEVGGYPRAQLWPIGYGAEHSLVGDPDLSGLDDRVEVHVACKK